MIITIARQIAHSRSGEWSRALIGGEDTPVRHAGVGHLDPATTTTPERRAPDLKKTGERWCPRHPRAKMPGMPPARGAALMTHPDVVVLGAGPAGLGAGLHAARAGARVVVVDKSHQVGGLCVPRTHGPLRYDLGGHIPFVHDTPRRAWLGEVPGGDPGL